MSLDISLCVTEPVEKYAANITHNLGKMAEAAGIYKILWHPEELGIKEAWELIDPLTAATKDMQERPEYYKQFDSPNGWGKYIHFLPWLYQLLDACKEFPESKIEVSV